MQTTKKPQSWNIQYTHMLAPLIILFSCGLLSFYLFGPLLKAQWWSHEDFAIMEFLGEDRALGFSEIPSWLMATEVGKWGESVRYRPSFWKLKLLECWLWGDNPFFWYLTRLLLFFTSLTMLWFMLYSQIGFFYSSVFALFISTFSCWPDIFAWLGPSEPYAIGGLALYAVGFLISWKAITHQTEKENRTFAKVSHLLILLGAFVAIGSKENFVILILPTLLLGCYAFLHKQLHAFMLVVVLIVTQYTLFIGVGIFLAMSKTGGDVYRQEVTVHSRLMIVFDQIPHIIQAFYLPVVLILLLGLGTIISRYYPERRHDYIASLQQYAVVTFFLIAIYLSQNLFYHGQWPTGMRYDMPGILALPLFYFFTLLTMMKSFRFIKIPEKIIHILILVSIIGIYWNSPHSFKEWGKIRQTSIKYADRTREFTQNIHSIVAQATKFPQMPLIFESADISDYEPIFSVRLFLLAYGVHNPLYLYVHPYSESTLDSPIKKQAAINLQLLNQYGGEGFLPLSQLSSLIEPCFVITFSCETNLKRNTLRIWN
ncbi:MAG: hypothetical protein GY801_16895 [bacterium]|nr:hypothetical protein [bacterium]